MTSVLPTSTHPRAVVGPRDCDCMNSTQKGSLLLNVSIFNKLSHRTCKRTCLRFQRQRLVGGEGGVHFCYREVCHSTWQAAGVGARRDDKEDKESVLLMRLLNGALCCERLRSSSSSTRLVAEARCSHVQHPSQNRRRRSFHSLTSQGRVTNPFLVVVGGCRVAVRMRWRLQIGKFKRKSCMLLVMAVESVDSSGLQ